MSDYIDGDMTPGGSRIIEGNERSERWTAPEDAAVNFDLIEQHLIPYFGEPSSVFHEILSDIVHLDILVYPPAGKRKDWFFVTSGMSDKRMTTPDGLDPVDFARAELMIGLPPEWGEKVSDFMNSTDREDREQVFWPISLMKWLARYPHEAGVYFADGHTIPNFDAEPYIPDSRLNGALLTYSLALPEDAFRVPLPDGDILNFYSVILLYPEEMDYKLEKGTDSLFHLLDTVKTSEVVNLSRRSAIKKKNPLLRLIGG